MEDSDREQSPFHKKTRSVKTEELDLDVALFQEDDASRQTGEDDATPRSRRVRDPTPIPDSEE